MLVWHRVRFCRRVRTTVSCMVSAWKRSRLSPASHSPVLSTWNLRSARVVIICLLHLFDSETHTHLFNGPFSGTTWVGRYQKGKTSLDFTEARDSEWQWHQLYHMQVCTSLQTDNHASSPPLSFLQAGCPSCRPTNSVKALKAVLDSLGDTKILDTRG